MRVTYRPIASDWVGERTAWPKNSPFRRAGRAKAGGGWESGGDMPWSDTQFQLDRELIALGADDVVFQLDMVERDIRNDGMPRADARPRTHAVIISFKSNHGHLRYQCDTFDHWQANVRAIALGLEALRKVDRYGITKRGEQYTGWKSLPSALNADSQKSAIEFLSQWAPSSVVVAGDYKEAYRIAAKQLHPDAGGTRENWAELQRAKEALGV